MLFATQHNRTTSKTLNIFCLKFMFTFNIIAAFLVGGAMIALLSLLAERVPSALGGIIISFPSTVAVSFVFLSITLGTDKLIQFIARIYYSMLGSIFFAFVFAFTSLLLSSAFSNKKLLIIATLLVSSSVWIIFPLYSANLTQTIWNSAVCLALGIILFQTGFIVYANRFPERPAIKKTSLFDLPLRGLFSGSIVALSIILAHNLGPFWGIVVGATYPAALASQLSIFLYRYPVECLPGFIRTVPVGAVSVATYVTVSAVTYPALGILMGTILAFTASIIMSFLISKFVSHFIFVKSNNCRVRTCKPKNHYVLSRLTIFPCFMSSLPIIFFRHITNMY
ncbi:membrane hypothetical protein [Crenothrix polyspora]|uniref:Uncharacterized protein n=1 Tax=Crenothrix polyspora TaxID=360316 RepID=A0A1R4H458_9GAMM|nr:membrane hypothetical protein [Crenothrix polyspora]